MSQLATDWEKEEVFDQAELYFDQLIADIDSATESVAFESYIFELGNIGGRVIDALLEASSRGATVRVLVDGVGSFRDCGNLAKRFQAANIDFRIYHPVPWRMDLYDLAVTRKKWYAKFFYFLAQLNRRDHRKLCIIDQKTAWTGSFNVTDDHFPDAPSRIHLSDLGVRLQGGGALRLLDEFDECWYDTGGLTKLKKFRAFLSNSSYQKRMYRNSRLIHAIKTAEVRVWIFAAYFSPCKPLLQAIEDTASNGIDVRIMVASRSDISVFPLVTRTFYKKMLEYNVDVYEYRKNILHSKSILIDDYCMLGSANLNHRSYFHDLEIDVVLQDSESIRFIEDKFISDQQECERITGLWLRNTLSTTYLFGLFLRVFKYWL